MYRTAIFCKHLNFTRTLIFSLKPPSTSIIHQPTQIRHLSWAFWRSSDSAPTELASTSEVVDVIDEENPIVDLGKQTLEDFGVDVRWYKPINYMMKFMEDTHVILELPWWQTIVIMTVLVRVSTMVLTTIMSAPNLKEGKHHLVENTHGISDVLATTLPIYAISRLNALPLPGLEHGGLFWFENLINIDPGMVLPILGTTILFCANITNKRFMNLMLSDFTRTQRQEALNKYTFSMVICHVPIAIGTCFLSSGASLSFLTSAALAPLFYALRGHYKRQEQPIETRQQAQENIKQWLRSKHAEHIHGGKPVVPTKPWEAKKIEEIPGTIAKVSKMPKKPQNKS